MEHPYIYIIRFVLWNRWVKISPKTSPKQGNSFPWKNSLMLSPAESPLTPMVIPGDRATRS